METDTYCPICNSSSRLVKEIQASYIKDSLYSYYNIGNLEQEFETPNYSLLKCNNCSLEFASPLEPGSNNFYEWITSQPSYYPAHRWEWDVVVGQIQGRDYGKGKLLEVGCGSGKFLELLQSLPNLESTGLDTTETSVQDCQDKGLNVMCETLESFLSIAEEQGKFDYVVAFHCLEHVVDPKGLVKAMKSALKPSGSIFLSTPYSPMSFETSWFDPLNHPPHHLTRWNERAYQELAKQLGLTAKFYLPKTSHSLSRTLTTLNYRWFGPAKTKPTKQILVTALGKPWELVAEWSKQIQREKLSHQVAPDTVLVELKFV